MKQTKVLKNGRENSVRGTGSSILELPEADRPYEKCIAKGASSLTDTELLAVLLRSGVPGQSALELAAEVLNLCRFESGLGGLLHLSLTQLTSLRGVGRVKAVQILCVCELSRRISQYSAKKGLDFRSPASIAEYYFESLRHQEQECVICMFLDTRNHLLGEKELTRGTVNQSLLSSRELYLEALAFHAVNIVLVHNHPSGDPTPSEEDVIVTRQISEAGKMLGISLLDHIVIGDKCYVSFLEEQIAF